MLRTIASAALAVGALAATPASSLAADCPDPPTAKVFAQWGDQNDYFLAPGGSFEGGSSWALSRAAPTDGSDPFALAGPGGSSLELGVGGSATSPEFCVSEAHSHLRFVARAGSRTTTDMKVWVRYYDDGGVLKEQTVEALPAKSHKAWSPTVAVPLSVTIDLNSEGVNQASVKLTTLEPWQVDDVYVDPFRR